MGTGELLAFLTAEVRSEPMVASSLETTTYLSGKRFDRLVIHFPSYLFPSVSLHQKSFHPQTFALCTSDTNGRLITFRRRGTG